MKTIIMMADSRPLSDDYNTYAALLNKRYTDLNGYDFLYIITMGNKRHPSWYKVKALDYCRSLGYDKVIYIDSDCFFKNSVGYEQYFTKELTIQGDKIDMSKSFIFLNDKPWSYNLPCAGFIIMNNNDTTLSFLESWYSLGNYYRNSLWNHSWEQGILQHRMKHWSGEIEIVDDWQFREKKDQLIRHIGGQEGFDRRGLILSEFNQVKSDFKDFNTDIKTIQTIILNISD